MSGNCCHLFPSPFECLPVACVCNIFVYNLSVIFSRSCPLGSAWFIFFSQKSRLFLYWWYPTLRSSFHVCLPTVVSFFFGSMPGVIQVCQAVVICHIFLPLFIHYPFSVAVLQKVPVPCHPYFRIMCCASFQWFRLVSSGTSVPKLGSTSSILNNFISSWRRSFLCYCWGGDPRPRNHLHPLNRDHAHPWQVRLYTMESLHALWDTLLHLYGCDVVMTLRDPLLH